MKYEIIYSIDEINANLSDIFKGTWTELQERIKRMKNNGCYNIEATCIDAEQEEE